MPGLGTVYVELDLDKDRYMRSQRTLLKEAKEGATTLEKNFKNLGIKSGATFDLMRAQAEKSFEAIKKSSKSTTDDIIRAEKAKATKIKKLNEEQYGHQVTSLEQIKKHWKGMAIAATAAMAAVGVVVYAASRALREAIELAKEQEAVEKRLASVIKSTGSAAGYTVEQLTSMASAMQRVTTVEDETIIAGMSILATFKNIRKEAFERTTQAALDMSDVMQQDLKSSVVMIAKAMNDPIANLSAMSRAGVQFTQTQKDMIKQLWESGKVMEAQNIILEEMESQFGGAAKAARDTFGGAQKAAKNAVGDLKEEIGFVITKNEAYIELLKQWEEWAIQLTEAINENKQALMELAQQGLVALISGIETAVLAIGFLVEGLKNISAYWLSIKSVMTQLNIMAKKTQVWSAENAAGMSTEEIRKLKGELIDLQQVYADITKAQSDLNKNNEDTNEIVFKITAALENLKKKLADVAVGTRVGALALDEFCEYGEKATETSNNIGDSLKGTKEETEHLAKALAKLEAKYEAFDKQYAKSALAAKKNFFRQMKIELFGYHDAVLAEMEKAQQQQLDMEERYWDYKEQAAKGAYKKQIDAAKDSNKTLEYLWENTINDMRSDFANFLEDWWNDELDEGESAFEAFCDNIISMASKLASQLIAYDIFGSLLGSGSSGIGLFTGGTSGTGILGSLFGTTTTTGTTGNNSTTGLLSNLVSIGKGIYSYFTSGMAAAAIGSGVASSVSGITAGTIGAVGGGVLGTAAVSGSVTTVAGALSSIAAAAPYAAAAVAAIGILMSIAGNQNKPDARGYMGLTAGLSSSSDSLFSVLNATYSAEGFSDEDAQKEIERITTEVGNTFSMYEEIWSYLSEESQKALKSSLEEIDWENIKMHFFTVAEEGAPMYSWIEQVFDLADVWSEENQDKFTSAISDYYTNQEGYFANFYDILQKADLSGNWNDAQDAFEDIIGSLSIPEDLADVITGLWRNYSGGTMKDLYQSFQDAIGTGTLQGLSSDEIAEVFWDYVNSMISSITSSGSTYMAGGTYSGTGAIHDLLSDYFTDYIEEGLTNIQASDIYQYMSEDVRSNFSQLTAQLFADDITSFYKIYNKSAAKIAKAQRIWDKLENLGEGYDYTVADRLSSMASAWGEAYSAIMEAAGEEVSEEDLAALVKDYYQSLADGTLDIDRAILGVSDLSIAVGALEGTMAAYKQQLEDSGVAIDEIADKLEEFSDKAMTKLLEDYKHTLGLISDEDYYTAVIDKIMETYSDYFSSAEDVVAAFKTASLDDIKAFAEALGLDWVDIADDVGWLVQALAALGTTATTTASSFAAWQAELLGLSDEYDIKQLAKKYGLQASAMTEDWYENFIEAVGAMTEEEFQALADALGVSVSTLKSDITSLGSAIAGLGTTIASVADDIKEILEGVRTTISGGGGATTAAGLMDQIVGIQESLPIDVASGDITLAGAMESLLEMSSLLADWYEAAIEEANEAAVAMAEYEGEMRTQEWLEAQRDTLQEQLSVAREFGNLVDTIKNTIQSITYSNLNVAVPRVKAEEAEQDWATLVAAAKASGSVEDYQAMVGFAQTALQQMQNEYMSNEKYQAFYATVMADLAEAQTYAEAQSYEEAILAELEAIEDAIENLEVTVDTSEIEAQFEAMAGWIENAIAAIQNIEYILNINWENYNGTMAEVLEMLLDLVAVYGWDNEIVLTWVSNMAAWAAQDIDLAIELMEQIATLSGGWNSQVSIAFIAALGANITNLTDAGKVLKYLLMNGATWDDEVTLRFVGAVAANIASATNAKNALSWLINNGAGWNSNVTMTFLANLDPDLIGLSRAELLLEYLLGDDWDPDLWVNLKAQLTDDSGTLMDTIDEWLTSIGITDEAIRRTITVTAIYDLVMSGDVSWIQVADFVQAEIMGAIGVWEEDLAAARSMLKTVEMLASMFSVRNAYDVGYWTGTQLGLDPDSSGSGAHNAWQTIYNHTEWAEGGIATEPTWGVFGEAGPEAFLRLDNDRYAPAMINSSNSQSITDRPIEINLALEIDGKPLDAKIKLISKKETENVRFNLVRSGNLTSRRRQPT